MSQIDNNIVVQALRNIQDPTAGQDIISAKRVSGLKIEGQNIHMTLDTAGMEDNVKQGLNFRCIEEIQKQYPDAQVHVHMKRSEGPGAQATQPLGQIRNIIAVASGKGGVGKSTVAVNLALGLQARGFKTGLLDGDLYGPSIPTMLGLKGARPKVVERYGKNKILPLQAHGLEVMSIGFIVEAEKAVILRGPRLAGIIKQFLFECLWSDLDYLVIDLPPGTGDIQLTLVQTVPLTGAVMVTTPQEVAIADALKAMNMFRMPNINVPILGVIENMAWFTPAELPDNKYYIFGQGGAASLAKEGGCTVLGQIPLVQSIREGGDAGKPAVISETDGTGVFSNLAKALQQSVDLRNKNSAPTEVVRVARD